MVGTVSGLGPEASVTDVCRWLLAEPDLLQFSYGRSEDRSLTRLDFLASCQAVATSVVDCSRPGDRVVILIDDLALSQAAVVGVTLAGRIAVPVSSDLARSVRGRPPRLEGVVSASEPALFITSSDDHCLPADWPTLNVARLGPTQPAPGSWCESDLDSIALIQFTSGSTSAPRGVCVSHRNLGANHQLISTAMGIERGCRVVSWLPLYHDMGLTAGVFQPLYTGIPATILNPRAFIRNPALWLNEISDSTERVVAGAPDFGYRWAVNRIRDQQLDDLDLTRWLVAFCGAERVQPSTVRQFAERFGACGFDSRSFLPCYGLAEATLFVSGTGLGQGATVSRFSGQGLGRGELVEPMVESDMVELVACGDEMADVDVAIVDANNRSVAEGQIGEIKVRAANVARGYWNSPEATGAAFDQLVDGRPGYLATGDLGAVVANRLYIVGRSKECFIHNGINYWPDDIEALVRATVDPGPMNLVVAVEIDGFSPAGQAAARESLPRVVIGVEVNKRDDLGRTCREIRRAVYDEFSLGSTTVVAVKRGTVPRTTSGKPQRTRWAGELLAGQVEILAQDPVGEPDPGSTDEVAALSRFLCAELAALLDLSEDTVNEDDHLADIGADSVVVVALASAIRNSAGMEIPVEAIVEAGTMRAVADLIVVGATAERAVATPLVGR